MPGGATSATATPITSLPYSDADTIPTTAGLWYTYTSPTPAVPNEIGLFVFSALVLGLRVRVFSPDAVTAFPANDPITGTHNVPVQLPVVAGVTYYFQVFSLSGVGAYTLSVIAGPNDPAPAGSIFINDDSAGWPLVLISATTGAPLRYIHPFPAGENADVIATGAYAGRILVHSRLQVGGDDHLKLYSPQFDLVADLDYTSTGGPRYPIRSNKTSRFYVGKPVDPTNANHASVTTVTADGAFGPTTWNLPAAGLLGLAPSLDETVLYFAGQTTVVASPVARWDLVHNVALSNLAAGIANYRTTDDILVLDDGTIVVSYENNLGNNNAPMVKRYSAAGATLNTYTMTGSRSVDIRLAYALDDPVSFWVWTKATNGISRFTNLRTSDGAVLTTFDVTQFEDGKYAGAPTATPLTRFGASESCPFLIIRATVPIPPITGTISLTAPSASAAVTGYVVPPRHPDAFCGDR